MGTIAIEGMHFHAYHGYYPEENVTGGHYIVDVYLDAGFEKAAEEDELSGTINYAEVYGMVSQVMGEKSKLLEHVARNISAALFRKYSLLRKAKVRVSKLNPPIRGNVDRVFVEIEEESPL